MAKEVYDATLRNDEGKDHVSLIAEFRPFAYYDKHLDCIRVYLHDCSTVEVRKNGIFTVMRALHSNGNVVQDDFAGFNIKGVRHLFHEIGLGFMDRKACLMVADVLTKIVEKFPDKSGRELEEKAQPVLKRAKIEIDWGSEQAIAA